MANVGSLAISVGADLSGFNAAMGDLNGKLKAAESQASSSWSGFEALAGRLTNVGTTLTAAITAPLVGIGAVAAKSFGEFESALNRVSALGEITGADLDKLKVQAIDLGAKTQFSATQAAEGMAELAAAGFKTTEVMSAVPAVMDLAAAGEISVGRSAEIAANLMGGFGIEAGDVGKAVDVMAKAAASGSLNINDLANTFKYVGPIAKAAGVSFEEVAAATTLLSNAGIKGEQAGTGLRGAIASLLDPSKEAAGALERLGIETTTADGKLRPFSQIIGELGAKGATTKDIFTIFGRETASAMQALISAGGPALQKMTAELQSSDGAAKAMAETMNKGFSGAMERMKGSIETAGIALGEALAPTIIQVAGLIEEGANKLAEFAKWFNDLPEPVKTTAIAIAGLAAALGPLLIVAGQVATAIISIQGALALAGPAVSGFVGAVGSSVAAFAPWVAAIGAATVAVYKLWEAFDGWQKAKANLDDAETRGADALNKLENRLRDNGYAVDALKKEYNDGRLSLTEYQKELQRLGKDLGDKQKTTEKATAATNKATKAEKDVAAAVAKVQAAVEKTTRAHKDYSVEVSQAAEKSETLTKKNEVLARMAELLEDRHKKAVDWVARYKLGLIDAANAVPQLIEINHQLATSVEQVGDSMGVVKGLSDGFQREMRLAFETPAPVASDTATKVGTSVEGIKTKLGEIPTKAKGIWEEFNTGLSGSLGKSATIWDDWSGGVKTKLGTFGTSITDALWKDPLSFGSEGLKKIGELGEAFVRDFANVIIRSGQELITGVISDLLGGKGFGGLIDRVKELGSSIAGVFGAGASAAGNAGGAAAGGAGSAGGGGIPGGGGAGGAAAGGLASTVSAIANVGSLISGVIGNFQNARQEGTLNAIEHNTRYSMMYLGERGDGGILARLYDISDTLKFGTIVQVLEQIRNYTMDNLPSMSEALSDINTRMDFAVRRLDQIGNDVLYGSHADQQQTSLLAEIRDAVRQGPKANVTVNVSGAASPQATADAIAATLRTQFAF